MIQTYRNIDKQFAREIKLIMSDVDGTMVKSGSRVSPDVQKSIEMLHESGIMIGLVSGRTLKELEKMAWRLSLKGPIIAENGAVAKLTPYSRPVDLGYSRDAALEALRNLHRVYPDKIRGREDNAERTMDIVIQAEGIPLDDIKKYIGAAQLLDSGYILHLMQEGINKGRTLVQVLDMIEQLHCKPEEVMVLGDSATDLSLFESFCKNVLVVNPNLPEGQAELMRERAAYISEHEYGEGFAEVAFHIAEQRKNEKVEE